MKNYLIKISKFYFFSFFIIINSFAIEVTHLIGQGSSFISVMTGKSCSTFQVTRDSINCNPALFSDYKFSGVQFNIIGKAEGDSIETGKNLILEPITEQQIRTLFNSNPFNSFSFNSNISFFNPLFKLSYSPYLLMGDILILNPAYPEISLNLFKRSTLSFSTGSDISWLFGNDDIKVSSGSTVNFYSQLNANNKFTLYELSSKEATSLVVFKKQSGITLDLSSLIEFKNLYNLKISNQLYNLFSKDKLNTSYQESASRLQNMYLFETYSTLGVGKSFNTNYGRFEFNIENYFSSIYSEIDPIQSTLGLNYTLGLFSFLGSIAKNYQSLGLHFLSQNFDVGIGFAREKNIGKYQKSFEDSVYLGIDFNL